MHTGCSNKTDCRASFLLCTMSVQVALLTKERDCLTAILESYDEEEDVIASHQKQGNAVALLATPEKAKDVRMKVRP